MAIRLNDLQLMLLSHAAQNKSGSLIPLPDSLANQPTHTNRAIKLLLRKGLADEKLNATKLATWCERDGIRIGVIITDAGRAAIQVEDDGDGSAESSPAAPSLPPAPAPPQRTKRAQLIDLLSRVGGATLDEMVCALGWLPHTTRAAMTGLRKAGMSIDSEKLNGDRRYYIVTLV